MKKILIGVLLGLLAIVGVIGGKIYIDNNKMENIVKSDKVKKITEDTLRKLDKNALTPEGKIKSYQIDDSYTYKNPMGGVGIKLIINNDNDLTVKTVLNKYPSIGVLEHGGIIKSRKMSELTPVNGKLYE